jgi:hypothetical protein
MKFRIDPEKLENILKDKGFVLKDKFIQSKQKLFCIDEFGYKYLVNLLEIIIINLIKIGVII